MKALLPLAALGLAALTSSVQAGDIKVGATPVPHSEILEFVKPMLKKQGVNLEIVEFNDYVQPNFATDDGSIDANFFQHRPYLDMFMKEHNLNLVDLGNVHVEPMGLYSSKVKKLSQIRRGAIIAIPNDPTNGGRALLLLAKQGLIKLSKMDVDVSVFDIEENKLRLRFQELEAATLPRVIDDVDAAVINTNYAIQAKLNPMKDAIVIEGADSPYANIVAASQDSKNNKDVQKLMRALQSDATKKFILKKYNGAVVPAF